MPDARLPTRARIVEVGPRDGVTLAALVPNLKGLEAALAQSG